ncbi:hypothetical protein Lpp71_13735 [Lacticaseibacillus paracasei subsp. paracasei Lpp71]|uniref:Uncharacterized protein n=1 Tax=Lacticaseibacillus paracasei subsp. paracasei Lpp71 TaxID=1256207 RepID=A0A8E0IPK8_LACPA|nr:hypothetical protein Lpp71_13735 [Lacticaseibacillus paracasei subsp. paracasei Lpp71]
MAKDIGIDLGTANVTDQCKKAKASS